MRKRGRRVAKEQGIATLTTLTVLELAAEQSLLDLSAVCDALKATTFHISDSLIDAALARDELRKREE